jgi:hypothetical protein
LVALFLLIAGCNDGPRNFKGIIGSYTVTISMDNKSDPDVMTISTGSGNTLLFTFIAGITTDVMGPNPNGLRGTLDGDGMTIKIPSQPAHIDHSTGQLDGMLSADGTIAKDGSSVMLNLHFVPSNLAIRDADGGLVPIPDGGAPTLEYVVAGSLQM